MKFLGSGKVKDIYEIDDEQILFRFSDRVSAYDVKFKEPIPEKGKILCQFAQYWFEKISVKNHFIKKHSENEIIVQKMKMLPIECVVRGYFYGSLVSRYKQGKISIPGCTDLELAQKLPEPIFDPTTKSEHDIPIDEQKAVEMGLVTKKEYDWLASKSIQIYNTMAQIVDNAGFILADLKLEFGKIGDEIVLGDSIGPDEYRLWLKSDYAVGKTQDAYDKQILRDWLAQNGYQKQFDDDRDAGKDPVPPAIPSEIIQKMTQRYSVAYQKITS